MMWISPIALAAKIQSIQDSDHPRLAEQLDAEPRLHELLWFLQYVSTEAGGLSEFAGAFLKRFEGRFEPVERNEVYFDDDGEDGFGSMAHRPRPYSAAECLSRAKSCLPRLLADMCIVKDASLSGPWFCRRLIPQLLEMMDFHRDQVLSRIADTAITREMFHLLDFSRKKRVPVAIVGHSRFGKTTATQAWCESRPGLARLVTVPPSNRERDFVVAYADAFGISHTASTTLVELRDQVEYVLKYSQLYLAHDESHFLIEGTRIRVTSSRRLEFVRCGVIDKGHGCSFIATPQSYKYSLERYAKDTGNTLVQWLGRMPEPLMLPSSLSQEDLLAVAEKKFPNVSKALRKMICGVALDSKGFLKTVDHIADYASYLAEERKAPAVALEDVEGAIRRFMPGSLDKMPAAPVQRARSRSAQPVQSAENRARFNVADAEALDA